MYGTYDVFMKTPLQVLVVDKVKQSDVTVNNKNMFNDVDTDCQIQK